MQDTAFNIGAQLAPILTSLFVGVILGLVTWGINTFNTWSQAHLGFQIDQAAAAEIENASRTAAGALFAKADGAIVNAKIDVKDPAIAQAAAAAFQSLSETAKNHGVTIDGIAMKIVGALGHLQATASSVPPTAAPGATT